MLLVWSLNKPVSLCSWSSPIWMWSAFTTIWGCPTVMPPTIRWQLTRPRPSANTALASSVPPSRQMRSASRVSQNGEFVQYIQWVSILIWSFFTQNTHNRHSIAHSWGMGYLLWIQSQMSLSYCYAVHIWWSVIMVILELAESDT